MRRIDHPSPAKIIGKVMRSNTVKSDHPFLETAVIGVYVLHVVNLADHPNSRSKIDWAMSDANFSYCGTQGSTAVGAKHCIGSQQWLERRTNVRLISLLKNKVRCVTSTITANQHRNLLVGQAAFRCFAASLVRCARHALLLALERFKEEGLIRFGNTNQAASLLYIGQRKETMTPAKRGIAMHLTNFCTVAQALTFSHLLRIVQPLVLVTQSGQWRSGQRIEGGAACSTSVTLQARCRTPARNVIMTALGTQWLTQHATFNQRTDSLNVFNLVQTVYYNAAILNSKSKHN